MSDENKRIHEWLGYCWHEAEHRESGNGGPWVWGCTKCDQERSELRGLDNPRYDTDGNACLSLIEAVREKGYRFLITEYEVGPNKGDTALYCLLSHDEQEGRYRGDADTLPMAVSLAVLKLIESEAGLTEDKDG